MEVFSTVPSATRANLAAANRVRLFYGVVYLSEITTADGISITRDVWEVHRPRISPLLWPFQPPPGPKSFRVWRCLLTDAFLRGPHLRVSVHTRDLQLCTAVGRWLSASTAFRYHWDAFYAPSTTSLYLISAAGCPSISMCPRKPGGASDILSRLSQTPLQVMFRSSRWTLFWLTMPKNPINW
jgi:hypothetical protein